jgi:hypothetical protein
MIQNGQRMAEEEGRKKSFLFIKYLNDLISTV